MSLGPGGNNGLLQPDCTRPTSSSLPLSPISSTGATINDVCNDSREKARDRGEKEWREERQRRRGGKGKEMTIERGGERESFEVNRVGWLVGW